jgi:hypothetical protein
MEIVFTAAATRQWLDLSADVRRRLDAKLTSFAETGLRGVPAPVCVWATGGSYSIPKVTRSSSSRSVIDERFMIERVS